MLKAVLFDMDGVIIDSEALHIEVNKEVMEACGHNVPLSYFEKFIGISNPVMWKEIKKEFLIDKTIEELMSLQERLNMEVLLTSDIDAIDGIKGLLENLKENGVKLGIGSSSSRSYIESVIKKFNIYDYFEAVTSGEEVKNGKPAPDVYLKVADNLSVLPSECAVIEDSFVGLSAGKKAGMFCIGYINPNSGKQDLSKADWIVKSIDEITSKKLLEKKRNPAING